MRDDGSGVQAFATGFERGMGLMSNVIDGKRRREFEDERMEMDRENFQRQGLQFAREGEMHDRRIKAHDTQVERDATRFEWDKENHTQAQAEHKQNLRIKRYQIEEAELKKDLPMIQSAYQKISIGRHDLLDQTEIDAIKRNPRYSPVKLADPVVGQALKIAQAALKGDIKSEDPRLIEAVNVLFEADVNKGSKGNKRIKKFLPGPQKGSLVFVLDVDGEEQPMTSGRGTSKDGDDEILQQPLEDLVKRVAGMQSLHTALQSPEARAAVMELGPLLGITPNGAAKGLSTNDKRLWDTVKGRHTTDQGSLNGKVTNWDAVAEEFTRINRNDLAQFAASSGSGAVDTSSAEYMKAQEMADKWVKAQAGYFSLDETDFADYGGNAEQARNAKTIEYYRQLKGGSGRGLSIGASNGIEPVSLTGSGEPQSASGLNVGQVIDGYRFIGGDPNNPQSWEPAQ